MINGDDEVISVAAELLLARPTATCVAHSLPSKFNYSHSQEILSFS